MVTIEVYNSFREGRNVDTSAEVVVVGKSTKYRLCGSKFHSFRLARVEG